MATTTSNNGPTLLRGDDVFILNPFTLVVDTTDEVVITAPVTVVILFGDEVQEDIIVVPSVTGKKITVTMTVEQLALLPSKTAKLNILFNGKYVIQRKMKPTTDGSVPTEVTASYSNATLGIFRVSLYNDESMAELIEDMYDQVVAAKDEVLAAMVDVNDRVPGFLDTLSSVILAGRVMNYITVGGSPLTASSGVAGVTIDAVNKTFQMLAGNNGAGSYMRQEYDLSIAENLRLGDKVNVYALVSQTVDGAISSSVLGLRLYDNTGAVIALAGGAPALYDVATKTFLLAGQYAVSNLAAGYRVEVYIKAGAPNQAADVNLRWLDVGIMQDKYTYEQAIDVIDTAIRAVDALQKKIEDGWVVSQIDMSGTTDVTAVWQAELDEAVNSSGKWMGRLGTPMIIAPLQLNGRLIMEGGGIDINVAIPTPLAPTAGAEAFLIYTDKPVNIRNLIARRLTANPTHQPTFCRFSATFVNKGSKFDRIEVYNMPRGMTIDYCDGLEIVDSVFGGGQFYGLRAGYTNPALMTNLKIHRCLFDTYLDVSAQVAALNGFEFMWNRIISNSGATFSGRGLDMAPAAGSHYKVRVMHNQIRVFREYGIALVAPNGSPVDDIVMGFNIMDDRTPDATDASSRPFHIAGNTKNITNIDVVLNHIWTKEIGIRIDNATGRVQNNTIRRSNIGGVYAASQGISATNMDYVSGGNSLYDLAVASSFGGTALTLI